MSRRSADASRGRRRRALHRQEGERLLPPRLLLLFAVGCLLFGYPMLGLFSHRTSFFGIPLLFVYLFAAWGVFIAAIAWLVEGRAQRADEAAERRASARTVP